MQEAALRIPIGVGERAPLYHCHAAEGEVFCENGGSGKPWKDSSSDVDISRSWLPKVD
jgi:hypothetical protein